MDNSSSKNESNQAEDDAKSKPKPDLESIASDDDFIITEAGGSSSDLVGLSSGGEGPIEHNQQPESVELDMGEIEPIGQSEPTLPPPPEESGTISPDETPAVDENSSEVKRLSNEEVKSIRNGMYRESGLLSEQEREQVLKSINPPPEQQTPAKSSPEATLPEMPAQANPEPDKPKHAQSVAKENPTARKQRRVAHFYRNFVQLHTSRPLRENDEITLRDKIYVLRRKNLSPKLVMGIAAPIIALVAFFMITSYVGGGNSGVGRVIGVALDDYGVPYEGGATIRFPELGRAYKTDTQGFFRSDRLPTGSHQVEYLIAGDLLATDFCTVVRNDLTTVILSPGTLEDTQPSGAASPRRQQSPIATVAEEPVAAKPEPPINKPVQTPKKASQPQPKWSKLTLAANIEGATLSLDGSVIGAGNMTYTRLKPGQHSYLITKDGFEAVEGTIRLNANSTQTLEANLAPLSAEAKAEVYSAEDYYYSAEANYQADNLQSALDDLSAAIELNPGYAEAYQKRGIVNRKAGLTEKAYNDYLRAGEIYSVARNYNQAASLFSNAIEINPKAIEPIIGRGHTYLATGQTIAAITDFESATKIDKKSHAAQYGLGVARFNHGQFKKAIKEFKKARSLAPEDANTHQYLMLAYLANNEVKNVQKTYAKFLKSATEQEIIQFHSDKRFSAIIRIIDMED